MSCWLAIRGHLYKYLLDSCSDTPGYSHSFWVLVLPQQMANGTQWDLCIIKNTDPMRSISFNKMHPIRWGQRYDHPICCRGWIWYEINFEKTKIRPNVSENASNGISGKAKRSQCLEKCTQQDQWESKNVPNLGEHTHHAQLWEYSLPAWHIDW